MSILGAIVSSSLKVTGAIIEGTGKTIKDCVEVVEQESRAYKASEEYKRACEERQVYIDEIKDSWKKIQKNTRELIKK